MIVFLGSCNVYRGQITRENAFKAALEINKPAKDGYIKVDPETGIQFYIPEDLVQDFPLPDGNNSKMVLVPGGEYIMGLNDEDPLGIQPTEHVRIAVSSFWLDQYEVTNKQYRSFVMQLDPIDRKKVLPDSLSWTKAIGMPFKVYFYDEAYDNYPVVGVSWDQAMQYARYVGKRLPTEAEWEYAARSGVTGRIYPWDGLYARDNRTGSIMANYAPSGDLAADGYVITAPVGSFPPNNFRLYDMSGNAAEWCYDSYFPSYKFLKHARRQMISPTFTNRGDKRRIVRGGSWASEDFFIGVGVRDYLPKTEGSPRVGFRLALNPDNPVLQERAREVFLERTSDLVNPNVIIVTKKEEDPDSVITQLEVGPQPLEPEAIGEEEPVVPPPPPGERKNIWQTVVGIWDKILDFFRRK